MADSTEGTNMPGPDWKRFERLVAAIHHAESKGGKVNWNDVIQGRQFDVSVRFKYGLHEYLTVVECKDYASKVPVEKVDALVTKSRDVKANKAILVSANGFQSGCVEVAERYGVKLLTLNEKIDLKVEDLAQEVTPALNIYSVRFVKSGSLEEYEFEDIGGRLAYLMNQAKIELKPKHITPNQLIDEWQLGCPNIYTDRENEIAIPLPSETVIHIPYELPFHVMAMRFRCSLIEAIIPNRPVLDNHIRECLATNVELRDVNGNLEHSTRLAYLKLGFDKGVQVGKFYAVPGLCNHYYCEDIQGSLVSWVLVESYQHGQLIRARIKQDVEHSGYYVEIIDEQIISRLQKLLANFNEK